MRTLREDGFDKVRVGKTTVEEVLSATESSEGPDAFSGTPRP
jgi:hypothetical protein